MQDQKRQPTPISAKQQKQSTQAGTKKDVFDPDKSRAMRQSNTAPPKVEPKEEQRLRLAGESEPPASMIGGVGGRPMSRRETKLEAVRDDAADTPAEGRMTGTNRSPKLIQKNRKRRAA